MGRRRLSRAQENLEHICLLSKQIGLDRGQLNEDRALRLLQEHQRSATHFPRWIKLFRASTIEEELEGIDIVVEVNEGHDLFLQVKSSYAAAKKFKKRSNDLWHRGIARPIVGMIISNVFLTNNKLLGRAMTEISGLRKIVTIQGSNRMPTMQQQA